ncbi:7-carboxy-7-deazaguanine synthase [compost metagenome]
MQNTNPTQTYKPGRKMPIMEIFGPTIQGEGMVIGRKTMFVRTGGCDYSCAWCDSAFTWNGEEKATMMTSMEVFEKLVALGTVFTNDGEGNARAHTNFSHVTISGGNPALIGDAMAEFIDICTDNRISVGLETQGTRWQHWFLSVDDLTISPKPPSSGMVTDFEKLDNIVNKLTEMADVSHESYNFTLKVVVFDDADFAYAKQIHQRYPHVGFYVSVGNEDAKTEEDISGRLINKLDWLWGKVLNDPAMNNVRPLPQLHTIVWANKRGV